MILQRTKSPQTFYTSRLKAVQDLKNADYDKTRIQKSFNRINESYSVERIKDDHKIRNDNNNHQCIMTTKTA